LATDESINVVNSYYLIMFVYFNLKNCFMNEKKEIIFIEIICAKNVKRVLQVP
jgi:hypothetical protein